MLRDHINTFYFDGNYNCTESVLRAANEYYKLGLHDRDMILCGGFGAGIQSGNTCGAFLSAVSVLSLKYIEQKAHESVDINPAVNMLIEDFSKRFGSLICSEIRPVAFVPEQRCLKTVIAACDAIEAVIENYEGKTLR